MKKTLLQIAIPLILLTILLVTSCLTLLILPSAMAATTYDLADYVTNDQTSIVTTKYEIYGNQYEMSAESFDTIVANGESKVYLHYRTDRNIDLYYDAQLCVKTTDKVYSFEFAEQERSDADFLVVAIKSFVNLYKQKITELQRSKPQKSATSGIPSVFANCEVDTEYVERLGNRGMIIYHIGVLKYETNNTSQIYIATMKTTFIPGRYERDRGDNSYGNYDNRSGMVSMTVEQAFDAYEADLYGIRYGGQTYIKDYWPTTSPCTVTIGSSVQNNHTFGFSSNDGFSVGEEYGISLGYSKAYTLEDPSLVVSQRASNTAMVQWDYRFKSNYGEKIPFRLETNYMFELSNDKNSLLKGDFRLKLDFMFETVWAVTGKKQTFSKDLFVGAGARHEIKPFNNGIR